MQGLAKNTPLHAAVNCRDNFGHIKVAQKLIEYDAEINAVNEYGSTPLHWASVGQFRDGYILRLLLKHGGDVNARATGAPAMYRRQVSQSYDILSVARIRDRVTDGYVILFKFLIGYLSAILLSIRIR